MNIAETAAIALGLAALLCDERLGVLLGMANLKYRVASSYLPPGQLDMSFVALLVRINCHQAQHHLSRS